MHSVDSIHNPLQYHFRCVKEPPSEWATEEACIRGFVEKLKAWKMKWTEGSPASQTEQYQTLVLEILNPCSTESIQDYLKQHPRK